MGSEKCVYVVDRIGTAKATQYHGSAQDAAFLVYSPCVHCGEVLGNLHMWNEQSQCCICWPYSGGRQASRVFLQAKMNIRKCGMNSCSSPQPTALLDAVEHALTLAICVILRKVLAFAVPIDNNAQLMCLGPRSLPFAVTPHRVRLTGRRGVHWIRGSGNVRASDCPHSFVWVLKGWPYAPFFVASF